MKILLRRAQLLLAVAFVSTLCACEKRSADSDAAAAAAAAAAEASDDYALAQPAATRTVQSQIVMEGVDAAAAATAEMQSASSDSAYPYVDQCTVDCSGHEAGYAWAEENDIEEPGDCDGNSDSFIEGCETYAQERLDQAEAEAEQAEAAEVDDDSAEF